LYSSLPSRRCVAERTLRQWPFITVSLSTGIHSPIFTHCIFSRSQSQYWSKHRSQSETTVTFSARTRTEKGVLAQQAPTVCGQDSNLSAPCVNLGRQLFPREGGQWIMYTFIIPVGAKNTECWVISGTNDEGCIVSERESRRGVYGGPNVACFEATFVIWQGQYVCLSISCHFCFWLCLEVHPSLPNGPSRAKAWRTQLRMLDAAERTDKPCGQSGRRVFTLQGCACHFHLLLSLSLESTDIALCSEQQADSLRGWCFTPKGERVGQGTKLSSLRTREPDGRLSRCHPVFVCCFRHIQATRGFCTFGLGTRLYCFNT